MEIDSNQAIEDILAGKLYPELILWGYKNGIFPMADDRTGEILWFSPDPRGIIPLHKLIIPRTLRSTIRKGVFKITINQAFEEVIKSCSARPHTWINDKIIENYIELHKTGYAHSVETWFEGKLAGGLYGVAIGSAFFGESMFHRVKDASKVALIGLIYHLRNQGFTLLDTQWLTPHLARFGGIEIPREEYLSLLKKSIDKPNTFFTTLTIELKL